MSEVDNSGGVTDPSASGQIGEQSSVQPEPGGQDAQDSVSYQSHAKLLAEKKAVQAKLQQEREAREKMEQARLEEQGKLSELVESLKTENARLKQQNTDVVGNFAYKSVRSQLMTEAAKVGCLNPNALAKLVDLDSFDVDTETFEASSDQMKAQIEVVRKENPWLFGKTSPAVNNSNPSVNASQTKQKMKPLKEMSQDDLLAGLAKAMKG